MKSPSFGGHGGLDNEIPDQCAIVLASSAQRGIWFLHQLTPNSQAYIVKRLFRVDGLLDVNALRQAFRATATRHEPLRTCLRAYENELYQVIYPEVSEEFWSYIELDREAPATALLLPDLLDLASAPLFRVRVTRISLNKHYVAIAVHHSIVDAASLALILDEVRERYSHRHDMRWQGPPAPRLQYADFAAWERSRADSQEYAADLSYWASVLRNVPAELALPLATHDSPPAGVLEFELAGANAFLSMIARNGSTPFVGLLTIFSGVLHRWSAQPLIAVGTSVSLRDSAQLSLAIGMLINSVTIVGRWSDDPTFEAALRQIGESTVGALDHSLAPFDKVVAATGSRPRSGRSPLFQVMFGWQRDVAPGLVLDGLAIIEVTISVSDAKYDLSLDCLQVGTRVHCFVEYSGPARHLAERLRGDLASVASVTARSPGSRVSEWLAE